MANKTDEEMQGMPRWVKWFGGVTALLVIIFVVVHLVGGAPRHH